MELLNSLPWSDVVNFGATTGTGCSSGAVWLCVLYYKLSCLEIYPQMYSHPSLSHAMNLAVTRAKVFFIPKWPEVGSEWQDDRIRILDLSSMLVM